MMSTTTEVITYERWLEMRSVEDAREEVVNGEILIIPPDKLPDPVVVQILNYEFARQLDRRRVQIFGSDFGLVVRREPLTRRAPDLAIFLKASMVEQDGYFHSPPELLIEVLSP